MGQTCMNAARNEQCPAECEQFRGNSDCCFECPNKCKQSYTNGERNDDCEKYFYLPECFRPCPQKCERDFENGVTNRECEIYASIPKCYYTPCSQKCMDAAANKQCPRECEKFEGNRACCGGCPKECRDAFQQKRTLEKCRKYGMTKQNMEISAFMRSVQRSAWMPLNLVTVCLSVKDMKAILDVAQVNVHWIVKRSHYGESVLQSASHLKVILTAVPLHVLPNVQIDEGRSAVQEVSQSAITFLVVVQNILMLSTELEFIFQKAVNQERFN